MAQKKFMAILLLAAAALFTVRTAAQHSMHHPAQCSSKAEMQGMTCHGGASGQMGPHDMMTHPVEMEKLVSQLKDSLARLEKEDNSEGSRKWVAEHRRLLEELEGRLTYCSQMRDEAPEKDLYGSWPTSP